MRTPTIEWQVCGVCNYDCSYCIQSKKSREGHPSAAEVERFLEFFESLPGSWEVKMSGGEPFAWKGFLDAVIPGLIARTRHRLGVLTNLSAPTRSLLRFAELTRGRLAIVSASLHLEFTTVDEFLERALALRGAMDAGARLVVNEVLVPGRLDEVKRARARVEAAGLPWFPQLFKTKHGVFDYGEEQGLVRDLVGRDPSPRRANVAPSYKGRTCYAGVEYFVLTQFGEAFACRTAKRFGEGYLGNVLEGKVSLWPEPTRCPYEICPCTVPANRGMIEGASGADERE